MWTQEHTHGHTLSRAHMSWEGTSAHKHSKVLIEASGVGHQLPSLVPPTRAVYHTSTPPPGAGTALPGATPLTTSRSVMRANLSLSRSNCFATFKNTTLPGQTDRQTDRRTTVKHTTCTHTRAGLTHSQHVGVACMPVQETHHQPIQHAASPLRGTPLPAVGKHSCGRGQVMLRHTLHSGYHGYLLD